MVRVPKVSSVLAALLTLFPALAPAKDGTIAQPNQLEFIIAVSDAAGTPVIDLTPHDVVMTENGALGKVLKVEPYRVPVKLTVAVDNGSDSREVLAHYRTGLTALVDTLPDDIEVTIVSTTPQPRTILRASTDRAQILRAIHGLALEDDRPRFTDTIVEFAQRLERDTKDQQGLPASLPILLMVSTTANEATSFQIPEIEKALNILVARRARLLVTMTSTRTGEGDAVADLNTNRQAIIAIPATKATRGRYEALAVSSHLNTLLPEMGREIAELHTRHANQLRVTVMRPHHMTGPLQNINVKIARPGLTGSVSGDGLPWSLVPGPWSLVPGP